MVDALVEFRAQAQAQAQPEVRDVDLLRQQIIVTFLRESQRSSEAIGQFVQNFFRMGVLTAAVLQEVKALLVEKGVKCPGHGQECANINELLKSNPLDFDSKIAMPSRFDQEFDRLGLLGKGAFGQVWRVRSKTDRKEYAVKMVPYQFNEGQDPYQHPALREAQMWASSAVAGAVRYHSAWVEVQAPDKEDKAGQQLRSEGEAPRLALNNRGSQSPSSTESVVESASGTESWTYPSSPSDDESGIVFFERSEGPKTGEAADEDEDEISTPSVDSGEADGRARLRLQAPRPAAITATNVGKRSAMLYLQTELVSGGTLRDWIDRRNEMMNTNGSLDADSQRFSFSAAGQMFRQCIEAVAQLHEQGLIHRDIKPGNILLTETGEVRLADFGLVTHHSKLPTPSVKSGCLMVEDGHCQSDEGNREVELTKGVGTPSYASPEQMTTGRYGAKADVYALGLVLAELIYPVHTQMERAQLFSSLRAGVVPEGFNDLCRQAAPLLRLMLDEDPSKRPSSMELRDLCQRCETSQVCLEVN